jgi:hypothetical protein
MNQQEGPFPSNLQKHFEGKQDALRGARLNENFPRIHWLIFSSKSGYKNLQYWVCKGGDISSQFPCRQINYSNCNPE